MIDDENTINSSGEVDADNIESFDQYTELYGLDKDDDGEKELEF